MDHPRGFALGRLLPPDGARLRRGGRGAGMPRPPRLDELALAWDIGPFAFEAGKTIANWGVGKAFSPADFFAEFDYSSGTPSRRSSLLARATWFAGATSRVDLVYAPYAASANALAGDAGSGGAVPSATPTSAIIAARAYATAFDSLAFALAAGFRGAAESSPASLLGALEATFDLPFVSPYGEASFTGGPGRQQSHRLFAPRRGPSPDRGTPASSPNTSTRPKPRPRTASSPRQAFPSTNGYPSPRPSSNYPESGRPDRGRKPSGQRHRRLEPRDHRLREPLESSSLERKTRALAARTSFLIRNTGTAGPFYGILKRYPGGLSCTKMWTPKVSFPQLEEEVVQFLGRARHFQEIHLTAREESGIHIL